MIKLQLNCSWLLSNLHPSVSAQIISSRLYVVYILYREEVEIFC